LKKTIVIGLGNPILTDDGVGIKVAQALRDALGSTARVDIKELYAGGIRLIDAMTGYEKAVIIDAMVTGSRSPGTICALSDTELGAARNISSTHDVNLSTAMDMGRMLGLQMPGEIKVFGIEAGEVEMFGETLTDAVDRAVPQAVRLITEDLRPEKERGVL
jgi:hydrogenase maturation protease